MTEYPTQDSTAFSLHTNSATSEIEGLVFEPFYISHSHFISLYTVSSK